MRLLKGFLVSVGVTLLGMLMLAAIIIWLGMSDALLKILNQAVKVIAVTLGALACVGRGGSRGLVSGAALGAIYAVAGYCAYSLLGGGAFSILGLLGEMLICVAAGAAAGAIFANLRAR